MTTRWQAYTTFADALSIGAGWAVIESMQGDFPISPYSTGDDFTVITNDQRHLPGSISGVSVAGLEVTLQSGRVVQLRRLVPGEFGAGINFTGMKSEEWKISSIR